MFQVLMCMFHQVESCKAMDTPCCRLEWLFVPISTIAALVVFHKTCCVPLRYVVATTELYFL
jgi:hypothetical protein